MKSTRMFPLSIAALVAAALLNLLSAAPAFAQTTAPSVSMTGATVDLHAGAETFVVPVTFDDGSHTDLLGSVAFTLEYDEACIRIADPDRDVELLMGGINLALSYIHTPDEGTLEISIYQVLASNALTDGTLLNVTFTVKPACRNVADDVITTISISDSPKPSFGFLLGIGHVEGEGSSTDFTLNVNNPPRTIAVTDNVGNMTENVTDDRVVGALSAYDPDGDPITYALSTNCAGVYDNDGFYLNPADTAEVKTDRVFNYESGVTSYPLCVQANDAFSGSARQIVTLSVANANDAPSDIMLSNSIIASGAVTGTVVGTLTTSDEDGDGENAAYELVSGIGATDNISFTISSNELRVSLLDDKRINYDEKPELKVRVKATNGAFAIEKQFTLRVAADAQLALPGEPDVSYVVAGQNVGVPVTFDPRGNGVTEAAFGLDYDEACLDYVNTTGLQTGFGVTDADEGGIVSLNIAAQGSAVLYKGVIAVVNFTAKECGAGKWTELKFEPAPTLKDATDQPVTAAGAGGNLVVMANSILGDCNNDGARNAGDLSGTAAEIFDADDTDWTLLNPKSWLLTPRSTFTGSPRGCDSNMDKIVEVSDIICTARLYFGYSCTTSAAAAASAASAPARLSAPAAVRVAAGETTDVPIVLASNGHQVAALAFALDVDPARIKLDAADADGDGVADIVSFPSSANFMRMTWVDAAAGKVMVLVTGVTFPLPVASDGVLATVKLEGKPGADGAASPIGLSVVSFGGVEGQSLPGSVGVLEDASNVWSRVFLPMVRN